ncbi:glycosyltransferase family 4 protein [Actinocorallia longicatena]|uniref:Glycosyl transferase family 1 domain-containing protein n=1 Tax=Actinocorallia longicatena TaxID=111803 RepID=A0ABP6QFU1_9ACTN
MRITYALMNANGMGGTVRTINTQVAAMADAGHEVELISALRWRRNPGFPYHPAVRIRHLTEAGSGVLDDGPSPEIPEGEPFRHRFTPGVVDAVADAFSRLDTDVLITTRPALNLLAARHAPEPVIRIGQVHNSIVQLCGDLRPAVAAEYRRLDAVVTLTETDRLGYAGLLGPGVRTAALPNALHSLDEPRCDPASKVVAAAGTLARRKGFPMLIKAFAQVVARHPDWKLRIYGHGPGRERLQELIFRLHLYNHVHLMGQSERLSAEFAKASVFALSSRREAFGMVLAEAMSQGLAPVSFDCPFGPREIITHGRDGLLVPPEDTDALAEALCRVIGDGAERARLGAEAARSTRARFGPRSQLEAWESLLADLRAARLTTA